MITVDGITIPKVVSIECNDNTGFMTFIQFFYDTRIEGCIELEKIEKLNPLCVQEQSVEEVGVYQIILNKNADIEVRS